MTKRTGGRALGSGRLIRTKRGHGDPVWVLDWRAADGVRRRQALSSDKRVAERMRSDLVNKRDLTLAGLGSIEGMNLPLTDLRDAYLTDLKPRVTKNHYRNVEVRTKRVLTAIRVQRVRDVQTTQILQMRAARVAAGAGHRTVNHEIANFRAMLIWAEKNGLIGQNPLRKIDPLPTDRGHIRRQRRAMSEDEIQRFLVALPAAQTIHRSGSAALTRPRLSRITTNSPCSSWTLNSSNHSPKPTLLKPSPPSN